MLLVKEDFNCLYIWCVFLSLFLPLFTRGPLQAVYMFYALALVCDDYFVPSLEKICEVREGESVGAGEQASEAAGHFCTCPSVLMTSSQHRNLGQRRRVTSV